MVFSVFSFRKISSILTDPEFLFLLIHFDEAINLTSEKHDHCARKVTYTKEENKNTL